MSEVSAVFPAHSIPFLGVYLHPIALLYFDMFPKAALYREAVHSRNILQELNVLD